MARKIAWEDLPEWAKRAIEKAGRFGMTQITRDSASLSISGGVARYNGMEVAPKGVAVAAEDQQEEVILDSELPRWALAKIRSASTGGQVQMVNGGDTLQVARGVAFFNGKRVVRSSHVVVSEEKPALDTVYAANKSAPIERSKGDILGKADRKQYVQVEMPDDSVWEVPLSSLMDLAIPKSVEKSDRTPDEAEKFARDVRDGKYHVSQLHDDFMDLTWGEVLSLGARMVKQPTPPPYDKWWKETNSTWDFRIVEHEPNI